MIYVHGGAWGSGDAAHYSQLAAKSQIRPKQSSSNFCWFLCILSYV